MDKEAYPQGFRSPQKSPFNLEKWKDVVTKIRITSRDYPEYSDKELVEYFTRKWEYQERESFNKWWRYNRTKRGQQDMTIQKVAYDYTLADKERQLDQLKKKLRGRINAAERILNKMLDEGLLGGSDDKALYISRILQKLKEEINMLKRPQLMQARHHRAGEIFRKAGLIELSDIMLGSVAIINALNSKRLVKTAQESSNNLNQVLSIIKEELDIFNYGVHLDKMIQIRNMLIGLNYHSEADMVVDIIKKDLDDLDGIHKKLVELYTALSQIPMKAQVTKAPEPPMQSRPIQPGR